MGEYWTGWNGMSERYCSGTLETKISGKHTSWYDLEIKWIKSASEKIHQNQYYSLFIYGWL